MSTHEDVDGAFSFRESLSDIYLLLHFFNHPDPEHVQWVLCKSFDGSSSQVQVLDIEFGVFLNSLKLVS